MTTNNHNSIKESEIARALAHLNQNGNKVAHLATCDNDILLRIDNLSMPMMRIGCAFRAVGYSVELQSAIGTYTRIAVSQLN